MAKQIVSCTPVQTTDAEFRAWGSAISTGLQALFTKVTQTGEINWSTVTKPTTTDDSRGFEVYRLNDSLHATAPIYFKVEYGAGSASTRAVMWFTVGKGADGSGTITGTLLARTLVLASNGNATATPKNCYIGNGDGSCLVMSLWPSDTAYQSFGSVLAIERSRDGNGNATAAAVMWQYAGSTGNANQNYAATDYTALTTVSMSFGCVPIPYQTASGVSLSNGVNTPVFTGSCLTTQREAWVPTALLGAARADFGVGVVATAIYSGIDYLALGAAASYSDMAKQQYSSILIRWD